MGLLAIVSVIVPSSLKKVVGHLGEAGQDRNEVVLGHEFLGRVSIAITSDADDAYAFMSYRFPFHLNHSKDRARRR